MHGRDRAPGTALLTGEVIFGGVGAGLYGMLMFAVLAVFIAGLMVGRTPEYVGKKIEKFEVQMAMLATLVLAASVLGFTALSSTLDLPKEGALAALQVARVAKARNLSPERVRQLIAEHQSGRLLGFLGEPRVNVLLLNIALDRLVVHEPN